MADLSMLTILFQERNESNNRVKTTEEASNRETMEETSTESQAQISKEKSWTFNKL